jgi:hypothetical protein
MRLELVDIGGTHLENQVKQEQQAELVEDSAHGVQADEQVADDLIELIDQNQNLIRKCLKSDE